MGLLYPQQIAMQTQCPGDKLNARRHAGILNVARYSRTIPYDPRSPLPILHSIDGAHATYFPTVAQRKIQYHQPT